MYYNMKEDMHIILLILLAFISIACISYICFVIRCKKIVKKINDINEKEICYAKNEIFKYMEEKAYIKDQYKCFDSHTSKSRSIVEKIPYNEMYYFNKYVAKEFQVDKYIRPLYKDLEDVEEIYNRAKEQMENVYSVISNTYKGIFNREIVINKVFKYLIGISAESISSVIFEFEFRYVSPKGQSHLSNYISINKMFLERFIEYEDNLKESKATSNNERGKLTQTLRTKVFERDGFTCCYCGASLANGRTVELHCDHIYPISKGGTTRMNNLQTLCKSCNLNKGDKWREIDKIAYKKRNNGELPE